MNFFLFKLLSVTVIQAFFYFVYIFVSLLQHLRHVSLLNALSF